MNNTTNNQIGEEDVAVNTSETVVASSHKRGRPVIDINFPQGNFEIGDLAKSYNTVSRVTLQLKVNKAVEVGKLKIVSVRQPKVGRPAKVFATV